MDWSANRRSEFTNLWVGLTRSHLSFEMGIYVVGVYDWFGDQRYGACCETNCSIFLGKANGIGVLAKLSFVKTLSGRYSPISVMPSAENGPSDNGVVVSTV